MSTPQSVDRDPEQMRAEIERTRHELGDTVAQLAYRADVKAQAREKVDAIKEKAAEHRVPIAAGAGLLAVAVVVRAIAKRR
jgi:hypothetical protein